MRYHSSLHTASAHPAYSYLEASLANKLPALLIDATLIIKYVDGAQVVALACLEIVRVVGGGDLQGSDINSDNEKACGLQICCSVVEVTAVQRFET